MLGRGWQLGKCMGRKAYWPLFGGSNDRDDLEFKIIIKQMLLAHYREMDFLILTGPDITAWPIPKN